MLCAELSSVQLLSDLNIFSCVTLNISQLTFLKAIFLTGSSVFFFIMNNNLYSTVYTRVLLELALCK